MTATEYCIEALIAWGKANGGNAGPAGADALHKAGDLAIRAGVKTPMDADGKFIPGTLQAQKP